MSAIAALWIAIPSCSASNLSTTVSQLHILRHTFCSRLAMAGASTMAIKELAGHQQISTTQRYMHLSPAAKSAAIRLLDRGADRIAEDLKDTENRGDTVETVSPSPQIPSNSA